MNTTSFGGIGKGGAVYAGRSDSVAWGLNLYGYVDDNPSLEHLFEDEAIEHYSYTGSTIVCYAMHSRRHERARKVCDSGDVFLFESHAGVLKFCERAALTPQ